MFSFEQFLINFSFTIYFLIVTFQLRKRGNSCRFVPALLTPKHLLGTLDLVGQDFPHLQYSVYLIMTFLANLNILQGSMDK